MKNDKLLNRVIEMIEGYIEREPNLQYYPTIYASRMELLEELKNSMLIPKPKFNIGDVVKCVVDDEQFIVDNCKYYMDDSEWYYKWRDYSADYHYTEDDLYLVESKNAMLTNTDLSDDDEIDPLVDDSEYDEYDDEDDEEYDEDGEFQNKPNTSQYTPLKHFIYDDTVYLVVLYSLNYDCNMEIQINEMDISKSTHNEDQYGSTIYYIEYNDACDVIDEGVDENVPIIDDTKRVLTMRTSSSWYSVPIEVMEFAIDCAKSILPTHVVSKKQWLTHYIDVLKVFKSLIQDIPHILTQVDKQIIEFENELTKIVKVN